MWESVAAVAAIAAVAVGIAGVLLQIHFARRPDLILGTAVNDGGDRARFRLTLRNDGEYPIENLRVVALLDGRPVTGAQYGPVTIQAGRESGRVTSFDVPAPAYVRFESARPIFAGDLSLRVTWGRWLRRARVIPYNQSVRLR